MLLFGVALSNNGGRGAAGAALSPFFTFQEEKTDSHTFEGRGAVGAVLSPFSESAVLSQC